jgi:hypothetical protein
VAERVLYTLAQETNVTYGMGDTGMAMRICKLGAYETGEFPPLFSTAEEAGKFKSALNDGVRYFVVGLKIANG